MHPIGIDPQQFLQAIHGDPATAREIDRLNASIGTRKLLLGMDRMDYSKGIPARLRAYKRFLDHHEEWRQRVSMIQVATLTRTSGRLSGPETTGGCTGRRDQWRLRHDNLDAAPIRTGICPFMKSTALLRRADVALVTPLRDGMNLVAKEYAACQENRPGALILSEFAGLPQKWARPSSSTRMMKGMGERIAEVLALSEDHLVERMTALHKRICARNVHMWTEKFLTSLRNIQPIKRTRPCPPANGSGCGWRMPGEQTGVVVGL